MSARKKPNRELEFMAHCAGIMKNISELCGPHNCFKVSVSHEQGCTSRVTCEYSVDTGLLEAIGYGPKSVEL